MPQITTVTPTKLLEDLSNPAARPSSFIIRQTGYSVWSGADWEVQEINSFFSVSHEDDCKLRTANNLHAIFKTHFDQIAGKKHPNIDPNKLVTALESYQSQFARGVSDQGKQNQINKNFNEMIGALNKKGYRSSNTFSMKALTIAPIATLVASSILSGGLTGDTTMWAGSLALAISPRILARPMEKVVDLTEKLKNRVHSIALSGMRVVTLMGSTRERLLWATPAITLLAASILSREIAGNALVWGVALSAAVAPGMFKHTIDAVIDAKNTAKSNISRGLELATPRAFRCVIALDQFLLGGMLTGGKCALAAVAAAVCSKDRNRNLLLLVPTVIQVTDRAFFNGSLTGAGWASLALAVAVR